MICTILTIIYILSIYGGYKFFKKTFHERCYLYGKPDLLDGTILCLLPVCNTIASIVYINEYFKNKKS